MITTRFLFWITILCLEMVSQKHAVFAQEMIVEVGGDTVYKKYNRDNFVKPIWGIELYHYDFKKFGVKFPSNAVFTSFGNGSRSSGFFFYAGLKYNRIRIVGFADVSGLLSPQNAVKDEWEKAILAKNDSLQATKANLNQRSYGIDIAYPIKVSNPLELTPVLGLHRWTFIAEFEISDPIKGNVANYYFQQKDFQNITLEIKLFLFQPFANKKKSSSKRSAFASLHQGGYYMEPSYKAFVGSDLYLINIELGIGHFVRHEHRSTNMTLGFYFNIGTFQGDLNSKIYRIGFKIR